MFIVNLSCECSSDSDGDRLISINVGFESEEHFYMEADCQFDNLIDDLNTYINSKYPGYYIDDCVECDKIYEQNMDIIPEIKIFNN